MKHKTLVIIALTTILCLSFLVPSVWAKRHPYWEGAAILLGTAVLLDALIPSAQPYYIPQPYYYPPPPRKVVHINRYPGPRRIWVPATRKKAWHRGYYGCYGHCPVTGK